MDLRDFLGRDPTGAERAICRDQAARLARGVYDNPLAAPGAGDAGLAIGFGGGPTSLCATPPFSPRDLAP